MADMQQCDIAKKLKKSPRWVSKYCRRDLSKPVNFYDAPRSGASVTALTPENMKVLEACEGKLGQSVTVLHAKLGIGTGTISRGFKKLGLFAYRRSVQSRLKKKHKKIRFATAKRMRNHGVEYWENYLITDEKIWTVDGYFNPQNDRVRARCKEDVEAVERDKFPGKHMVWLGMSARALTGLVHFKGSVNGTVYREKVLKKVVLEDVLQRKNPRGSPFISGKCSNGMWT